MEVSQPARGWATEEIRGRGEERGRWRGEGEGREERGRWRGGGMRGGARDGACNSSRKNCGTTGLSGRLVILVVPSSLLYRILEGTYANGSSFSALQHKCECS